VSEEAGDIETYSDYKRGHAAWQAGLHAFGFLFVRKVTSFWDFML